MDNEKEVLTFTIKDKDGKEISLFMDFKAWQAQAKWFEEKEGKTIKGVYGL